MKIEKHEIKRVPLWKWLVIILLVLAMPMFFSFIGDMQIQQVFTSDNENSKSN